MLRSIPIASAPVWLVKRLISIADLPAMAASLTAPVGHVTVGRLDAQALRS
ncbi:hypothetical protein [Rhodopila sp.]|uniref:hypothetical protein n=1 Tax=Rhodopila sp. TaxID=2480087 RepID=UPI003D0B5C53